MTELILWYVMMHVILNLVCTTKVASIYVYLFSPSTPFTLMKSNSSTRVNTPLVPAMGIRPKACSQMYALDVRLQLHGYVQLSLLRAGHHLGHLHRALYKAHIKAHHKHTHTYHEHSCTRRPIIHTYTLPLTRAHTYMHSYTTTTTTTPTNSSTHMHKLYA